jgi:predicted DNA-binding helix-hairpin-helix protein
VDRAMKAARDADLIIYVVDGSRPLDESDREIIEFIRDRKTIVLLNKSDLDLEVDPKLAWALRHPEQFPVDVNRAEYERILRVPGIGVKSARLIVCSRRFGRLTSFDLKKMGCVMKRAQYFITCGELEAKGVNELYPERVRSLLVQSKSRKKQNDGQLTLLFKEEPA